MAYTRWEYQNLALAATVQCAALVESLASSGDADLKSMRTSLSPLFNFNPGSVADLYPDPRQLSMGLRAVQEIFGRDRTSRSGEIIRYLLGILALRQKLMSDHGMQDRVRAELEGIVSQEVLTGHGGEEAIDQFFAQIADAYQSTISTYSFRIHVKGNLEFLRQDQVANRVRACLFAGIRAAVLWYQIGGRRWHLVLHRRKIEKTASDLRRSLLSTA